VPGVVAAGHPESAEAGAAALRAGGNAVDAAVAAMLASFAVESPLTGLGAGGFMLVHDGTEATLLDFFVAAPGLDGTPRSAELVPVEVVFDAETVQTFYVGPVSCGVPGTPAGMVEALRRFGSMPLADLAAPAIRLARDGAPVNHEQAYVLEILAPIHDRLPGTRQLYAPEGWTLREGETFRFPALANELERFAAEGAEPFYRGGVATALSDFVVEAGGTLGRGDFARYEVVERPPVRVGFRGTEVITNPPPSAGGTLIAHSMEVLERLGPRSGPEELVAAMDAANDHRASLLGQTTHISAIDGDGLSVAVTCSNGSGSGVLVPGTGVILNNMLGEEDLNPGGFHLIPAGTRVTSMMAPTMVLRGGEVVLAVGSAGSNRIRSAILQTVVRVVEQGMGPAAAIAAPRLHFEGGVVQAEPGIDEAALARLEARGVTVARRPEINLFFGGTQAVARDPRTGDLSGGGDPRRGGAAART
jgi:gamma-glutamyltranspeptidase / glutathione hydrolase